MDWLEEFFPFLEEIDQGSGALEIAFVVLIVGVLGLIGLAAIRRRGPAKVESREQEHPGDDQPSNG